MRGSQKKRSPSCENRLHLHAKTAFIFSEIHSYSYVESQPTNYIDPSGLFIEGAPRAGCRAVYDENGDFRRWDCPPLSIPSFYYWGGWDSGRTIPWDLEFGGGGGRASSICDGLEKNDAFNAFAREIWAKGSENEATGVFGSRVDTGEYPMGTSLDFYRVGSDVGTPIRAAVGSSDWAVKVINEEKDTIIYSFWVHTHPGGNLNPSAPWTNGTGKGDTEALAGIRTKTKRLDLLGIIIGNGNFSVFNAAGKKLCEGKWVGIISIE